MHPTKGGIFALHAHCTLHMVPNKSSKTAPFQSASKCSPQSEAITCLLTIPWPNTACQNTKWHPFGGVFAQRAHSACTARTAPVTTVFTPVTALKTCHL